MPCDFCVLMHSVLKFLAIDITALRIHHMIHSCFLGKKENSIRQFGCGLPLTTNQIQRQVLHRLVNIDGFATMTLRLQRLYQNANVLVENRRELVNDIVRKRRIQEFAMPPPVVPFRRDQAVSQEVLNVLVRASFVDAYR